MAKKSTKKKPATKRIVDKKVWEDGPWQVQRGRLVRRPGHPGKVQSLFSIIAEKLPFDSLNSVREQVLELTKGKPPEGVYIAHDSMGCPRYIGRGRIFARLKARLKAQPLELRYYSFYVIRDKKHEREIETLLIRAASPLLHFNEKKKRVDIKAGLITDYEAGTRFFRRQRIRKG